MQSVCDNPAISCEETATITHLLLHRDAHSECGQNLTDHVSINQDTDAAGRQFNCRMTDVTDQDPARVSCAITFGGRRAARFNDHLHSFDNRQNSAQSSQVHKVTDLCLDVAILCFLLWIQKSTLKSANSDCCQCRPSLSCSSRLLISGSVGGALHKKSTASDDITRKSTIH